MMILKISVINQNKKADSLSDHRLLIIFQRRLHFPILGIFHLVNVIDAVSLSKNLVLRK